MEKSTKYFIFSLIILSLMGIIIFTSEASAEDYLPHKAGTDFFLTVVSNNATSCNYTYIQYPNGSTSVFNNAMNKSSQTFFYEIDGSNLNEIGNTCFGVVCTDGVGFATGSICRDVNPQGFQINTSRSIIYIGGAVFIFLIFLTLLYFAVAVPWKDYYQDETGLSIAYYKPLKISLFFGAYLSLMLFFATAKGVSYAFLASTEIYTFFNIGLIVLLVGIIPATALTITFFVMNYIAREELFKALKWQ